MKGHLYAFIILFSISAASCKKDDAQPQNNVRTELSVNNEAYGTDAQQKMDYYLPANRTDTGTKVMILIHGGGWSAGDKTDFNNFMADIKTYFPGWAIFNINYRLAAGNSNLFPTQELDVRAAAEYIFNNAGQFHISGKFVLVGASAGAHLALLQGNKNHNLPVKAIVNFFGPTDITDMYNNPLSALIPPAIEAVVGATPTSNPNLYFQSSPINFVTAQSPPTISLQGGMDPLVNPAQQLALKAKLDASSVINEYVFYPNEAHGWVGASMTDSYNRIKTFITANVQ
ncbi:MAG: alpha/beta hydrolase [Ferruginibacter sp.]